MMVVFLSGFQECKRILSPCYSLPTSHWFKLFFDFQKNIFYALAAPFSIDKASAPDT